MEEARHRLHALARLGINLGRVVGELEDEGVMAFERSYEELFSTVAAAAGARRASRPAKPRVSTEQQEDTACAVRSTSL